MTSVEQRKMVQRLKLKTAKMTPQEHREYDMMAKRDKDDEDLDVLTMTKLRQMYAKYFPKHSKDSLEDAWSKLTGG
jgi:hypothetical protein